MQGEQIILLYAAQKRLFEHIKPKEMKEYKDELMNYIRSYGQDIIEEIEEKKVLTEDLMERIEKIVSAFEE